MTGVAVQAVALNCPACGGVACVVSVSADSEAGGLDSGMLARLQARGAVWGCKLCGAASYGFAGNDLSDEGQVEDPWGTVVDAQVHSCRVEDMRRGTPGGGGGSGPKRQAKPGDRLMGRPEQEPWPGMELDRDTTTERVECKSEVLRCRVTPSEKRFFATEAKSRGLSESELLHLAVLRLLFADQVEGNSAET